MDPLAAVTDSSGYFTRAMALDSGYDDDDLTQSVRAGVLRRFRHGHYAFAEHWDPLDDVGRHRIRSRAVLDALGDAVALSHVSAAIEHGAQIWGYPLDRVHVTRLDDGAGRQEGDIVHHKGLLPAHDLVTTNGRLVTGPDRSALETATLGTPEAALTLFNSLAHAGACDVEQLRGRHEVMRHWPGARRLRVPLAMADPRPESIGESRGIWLCWAHHLPSPEPQFEVWSASGVLLGTCDWGWPDHGLVGEFDGRVKYGRLLQPGQSAGEVVFAEKQREDQIREEADVGMVRLIWDDYQRPRLTADRIRRKLKRR